MATAAQVEAHKRFVAQIQKVAIAAIPLTIAGATYYAKHDLSVPISSRRPGGTPPITWAEHPVAFVFGFVIVYGATVFVGMLVVPAVIALFNALFGGKNRR